MHAGGGVVVDLHPVHSDIPLAGVGVVGDDAGQGDESSAIQGPALKDGEVEQRGHWAGGGR